MGGLVACWVSDVWTRLSGWVKTGLMDVGGGVLAGERSSFIRREERVGLMGDNKRMWKRNEICDGGLLSGGYNKNMKDNTIG